MARGRATLAVLAVILVAGCSAAAQPRATLSPTRPSSLAIGPKGQLYVVDDARDQILQALPGGKFRVIAGTGKAGFSGDGGPATKAELNDPGGMAVAPDGTIYLADTGNNRVREIAADGTIETVAGNGTAAQWVRDGTRPLSAGLSGPVDVALATAGTLYIADESEIVKVGADGRIQIVAGQPGLRGAPRAGALASRTSADGPSGMAFDRSGNLFVFGFNTKALYMISRSGRVVMPIGAHGSFYPRGPAGLAAAPSGDVIALDTQQIVKVTRTGLQVLDTLPATLLPEGIAIAPSGTIYLDTWLGNGWSTQTALYKLDATGRPAFIWQNSIS
jgi:sugar lactone lactonase YvrE